MDVPPECTLITQSHLHQPLTPTRSPLKSTAMNNITPSRAKLSSSPSKTRTESPTRPNEIIHKQYLELATKLANVSRDYSHLEEELNKKSQLVQELSIKISDSERIIRSLEEQRHKNNELFEREIKFYKESMEELQRRNHRISQKLEVGQIHSQAVSSEAEEKLGKLMRSYKVLESNLELEQNSRALLMDQIEYLTKERDFLLESANTQDLSEGESQSFIHHNPYEGQNSDSESDGSVHGTRLLDSLVEEMENHEVETSSPIKYPFSDHSLDVSQNFQFPPTNIPPLSHDINASPPLADPSIQLNKRQSLPVKLQSLNSPTIEEEEFVLSPLKLANTSNSMVDMLPTPNSATVTKKRYSSSKPNHSRYNSHDIIPIKVEFELLDHQLRSASSPDKDYLRHLRTVDEAQDLEGDREQAFMKLNGYSDNSSKRNSVITSSSKRSSLMTDFNILGNDVTKQEIMKLKFELQSLKLHNEKLLSYIGFELQKQKKNIKKLSSKQNLRGNIEYSDAKLIEKLRNVLIHKKRVLRSVSINPILSSKYNRNCSIIQPGVGIGFDRLPENEEEEDFVFNSHFINSIDDCDDYGFLNHESKYNLRVLSRKNQVYLNEEDTRTPKKFKSQTFRPMNVEEVSFIDDDDEENSSMLVEEEEYESENSSGSEIDYNKLNTFNQMRYLIFGKQHLVKRSKGAESLVDENLKYKFLTIVIGIVIVGIKFTSHPQQHLSHN
ncbi:CIC11C00000004566 [Sungouiella intermedia]|uniref:CIC11C00000004566 n=1 Tax=Sungouiella intermedia TaxID=45354 RepID=A0A1L0BNZ2_9ASCO|nr:CIC11C00000004566 [[Candida] intermedia]